MAIEFTKVNPFTPPTDAALQLSTEPTVLPPFMDASTADLDPDTKIKTQLEFQLHEYLEDIKQKYASFVTRLCECVKDRRVTTENLRTFLTNMSPFDTDGDLRSRMKLQEAGTVNEIFDLVSIEGAL